MSVFPPPSVSSSIPFSVRRQRLLRRINTWLKGRQQLFDFQVTLDDPLLIGPIQLTPLPQGEQMLGSPVAHERFSDCLRVRLNTRVPQLGQLRRVPLTLQDGVHHR